MKQITDQKNVVGKEVKDTRIISSYIAIIFKDDTFCVFKTPSSIFTEQNSFLEDKIDLSWLTLNEIVALGLDDYDTMKRYGFDLIKD